MFHCVRFNQAKTLFLFDNKDFRHRIVKIGYCPKCKKTVVEVFEERKADGKVFYEQKSGYEAINYLAKINSNVDYTSERKKEKNIPIGWKYGINIETKSGEIKQYACDFNNKKELVKSFKL